MDDCRSTKRSISVAIDTARAATIAATTTHPSHLHTQALLALVVPGCVDYILNLVQRVSDLKHCCQQSHFEV